MSVKHKKYQSKVDRVALSNQNEKIISDLLLQFAYTLTICVLTIFVFNAIGAVEYGYSTCITIRGILWFLFGASMVLGIIFALLYKNKDNVGYKTTSIYSFVTAFVMFWYVGVEKITYFLQSYIPFMNKFVGTYKVVMMMFPLLAIALVVEFVVYFVRYYSLVNSKKK